MEPFQCDECDQKSYQYKRNLMRHKIEKHQKSNIKCNDCKKIFAREETLKKHLCKKSKENPAKHSSPSLSECLVTVKYKFTMDDLVLELTKYKSNVIKELNTQLNKMKAIKWN